MSQFVPAGVPRTAAPSQATDLATSIISRDPSLPLQQDERKLLDRLLGEPAALPQAFWAAIIDRVVVDAPSQIPVTQLSGFPRTLRVLDQSAEVVSVAGTNLTETSVYSYLVKGGTMGASRTLRVTALYEYTYAGNTTHTWVFRVRLGGTELYTHNFSSGNGNVNSFMGIAETISIVNTDVNAQLAFPATLTGTPNVQVTLATGAVDTSVDQTLSLSVDWNGSSSSSTSWRKRYVAVELL